MLVLLRSIPFLTPPFSNMRRFADCNPSPDQPSSLLKGAKVQPMSTVLGCTYSIDMPPKKLMLASELTPSYSFFTTRVSYSPSADGGRCYDISRHVCFCLEVHRIHIVYVCQQIKCGVWVKGSVVIGLIGQLRAVSCWLRRSMVAVCTDADQNTSRRRLRPRSL